MFKKLSWRAEIFTISFSSHFATTATSPLANFQKKIKIRETLVITHNIMVIPLYITVITDQITVITNKSR